MRTRRFDTDNRQSVEGVVNADGSVAAGSDFLVTRTGAGAYTIRFTKPFKNKPSIRVTTQVGTFVFGVTNNVTSESFQVSVYASTTGAVSDSIFHFSAEGLARI